MLFDVFISHASEDKDNFVRLLATELRKQHIEVWYDEFSLKPGDSIRRALDIGLSKSRYGIVVLSKSFFKKEWTQWELDGLVQKLNRGQGNCIIPIWHEISYGDLVDYSPSLADRMAILSSKGIEYVTNEIVKVLKPEGSTLIIARDYLIKKFGVEPPVVTDDWWLDVIEFSGTDFHMEKWGFPSVPKDIEACSKGERIAWIALQMMWQPESEKQNISQISHPSQVLGFIQNCPGLEEMGHSFPDWLAIYAPQLTIKGFGGPFESDFDNLLSKSCDVGTLRRTNKDSSGTALTTNGLVPICDEVVALRHHTFGDYYPSIIACNFVQGPLMGPTPRAYENMDYIVWLLSSHSDWMPIEIRQFLLEGMKDWNCWPWDKYDAQYNEQLKLDYSSSGKLAYALHKAKRHKDFIFTKACSTDLRTRIHNSLNLLVLEDSVDDIFDRFMNHRFIERWFEASTKRKKSI